MGRHLTDHYGIFVPRYWFELGLAINMRYVGRWSDANGLEETRTASVFKWCAAVNLTLIAKTKEC